MDKSSVHLTRFRRKFEVLEDESIPFFIKVITPFRTIVLNSDGHNEWFQHTNESFAHGKKYGSQTDFRILFNILKQCIL